MPPRSLQRIIDTFLPIEVAFSAPMRRDIYKTYSEFEGSYRQGCCNRPGNQVNEQTQNRMLNPSPYAGKIDSHDE